MEGRWAFAVGVGGIVAAGLPLVVGVAGLVGVLLLDWTRPSTLSKSLTLAYLTHYLLWKLPLLCTSLYFWDSYPSSTSACLYLLTLAVYHCSEHLCSAYYHAEKVNWHSFLLDQSWHYGLAMLVSFLELGVRFYFGLYIQWMWEVCFPIGAICVAIGQVIRIGAEINAGRNFTHTISYSKQPTHTLVTTGLYSVCRHPGYFGWYLWSVATQLMLCNPISVVLFFYASRIFFTERIDNEDDTLEYFFRGEFMRYRAQVSAFPKGFNWLLGKTGRQ